MSAQGEDVDRILNIPVPIIVYLADKPMRVEDVMNLGPGSIIEFQKGADQLLDIYISDRPVGKGEVVKVGETFGIQVKEIGTAREIIQKLGGH